MRDISANGVQGDNHLRRAMIRTGKPTEIQRSTITVRRFYAKDKLVEESQPGLLTSARVIETVLTRDMLYRRLLMHSEEAGMPMLAPIRNFVARP